MDSMPVVGDIIFADRGLYKHFGVYIGLGQVIHFAAPYGDETNAKEADICQTTIKDFLKDNDLFIIREKENSEYKPLPPEEIVARAKSKIGKCKGTYSLVSNNCEHFAYWCRYDKAVSKQVDDVAGVITAVGFFPLILLNMLMALSKVHDAFSFDGDSSLMKFINRKTINVKSLGMKEIISYFKNPKRLELLKKDENKIAVAIREKNSDDSYKIVCCIFDKQANEVANIEDAAFYNAETLEEDLLEAFGDKAMIILQ